jgi:predicted nucleotidyltransferase
MSTETAIRLTAQLYEMRSAARVLLGKNFAEQMAFMSCVLQRIAEQRKTDLLAAAQWLAARQESGDGIERIRIFAAYVESVDPSIVESERPTAGSNAA